MTIAGFLAIRGIVSLFSAAFSTINHFASDPTAKWKVPAMVSAQGRPLQSFRRSLAAEGTGDGFST